METLSDKGKLQNNIYIFKIDKIDNPLASLVKKKLAWGGRKYKSTILRMKRGYNFREKQTL